MSRLPDNVRPISIDFIKNFFDGFEEVGTSKYPPVNVKTVTKYGSVYTANECSYEIQVATAGFRKNELTIKCEDKTVHIKGSTKKREPVFNPALVPYGDDNTNQKREDVINQIALRDFHKVFTFGTDIEVESATYVDGLLEIKVVPKAPKEGKVIEIT